ncbi:hypothetical protein BDF14DRAFT_1794250 [Spinellus fusiger]|nr:hypothetical protein BDF14DRAFT_1794250 [Spinellus fusiger]
MSCSPSRLDFYPLPPYYSSGIFVWSSPFFIVSTVLITLVIACGLGRYGSTYHITGTTGQFKPTQLLSRELSPLSKLIVILSLVVIISFLGDAAVLVTRVFVDGYWMSTLLAYSIACCWAAWVINVGMLFRETYLFSKWHWLPYVFWSTAFVGDSLMCGLWVLAIYHPRPGTLFSVFDRVLLGIFVTRYLIECVILLLSIVHLFSRPSAMYTPLLSCARPTSYDSLSTPHHRTSCTRDSQEHHHHHHHQQQQYRKNKDTAHFLGYFRKVLPYTWPYQHKQLQFSVLLCFALMILGLVVNIYTPLQIGKIVDSFQNTPGKFAWAAVVGFVGLKFLQGTSGLIQAIQNWLWIPIGQYTTRKISVDMFNHLHSLSLQFHIHRKTGEVLRVMDRGSNSVIQLLNQVVFQVFPTLINGILAVVVFYIKFSPPFGVIVLLTMVLYLYVTIRLTEWRNHFRRQMNEKDSETRTKSVDALLNFETVQYYGNDAFEIARYKDAIIEYQKADWKCSISLNILTLAQNAVITAGLLAGSLLFAWEVSKGNLTAGDFVAFNIYMMQLYTPLHFFGLYYRMIQQNFIDMERMFVLFDERTTVLDAPDAKDLVLCQGSIVFDNVSFSYDGQRSILNNLSFSIPHGSTVAFVGPSGGGKSTIFRLLFRFYDSNAGHIYIHGQDIRKVKQASLRKKIGVVPQDAVLFNDTIAYNIRYADVDANEERVVEAAKAAQMHEKILSFPDGYETKVGERGLRLSGGEKQRVAMARTLLKNPPIILLDEATSALDTTTECQIQEALAKMTLNRTTLIIAHRLSTIAHADLILVIKDGSVVEQGTHEELIKKTALDQQGVYYDMWHQQLYESQSKKEV